MAQHFAAPPPDTTVRRAGACSRPAQSGIFNDNGTVFRGADIMPDQPSLEFSALRATIRERGTARVVVFSFGIAVWAALVFVMAAAIQVPAAVLVPLVVLLATFEAVYALHVGVERVGRYLQVFHSDAWENTAMAYGRRFPGSGPDPLFSGVLGIATLVNLLAMVALDPMPAEWIPLGLAHAAFVLRIDWARRRAARQRAEDLGRFRAIAGSESPPGTPEP
jgi:hypothetical protein